MCVVFGFLIKRVVIHNSYPCFSGVFSQEGFIATSRLLYLNWELKTHCFFNSQFIDTHVLRTYDGAHYYVERVMKRYVLSVLSVLSLLLCISCGEKKKDSLVVATTLQDLVTLDPAEIFEFAGMEYAYNTYNTLVTYDPQSPEKIEGEIAESWAFSDDGKTLTFKIRPGIKFSSGNPLTAEDVVFSLQRTVILGKQSSQVLTQFGFTAQNVHQKIHSPDAQTVVLEMDEPYAETLVLYCLNSTAGAIVDKKEVLQHEVEGDLGHKWLKTHHAGSGPFRLGVWKPNEVLTLVSSAGYFRGEPKLKKIIFQHLPDPASGVLMLEKGDVDILRNVDMSPEQVDSLKGRADLKRVPQGFTRYMILNQKNKHLKIPEVQQAIRHLIDYEGIVQSISKGDSFIHQCFIPKGFFGALNENPYTYDPEKAKALLEKVGLKDGFSITLETTSSEMGQALQAGFAKGGISLTVHHGDSKQVLTKIRERRYEMGLALWGPDYFDPHANAATFARNPDNSDNAREKTVAWRAAWEIPELTKTTESAILESDPKKRAALYGEIQKKLLESPIINMFQQDRVVFMARNIKGVVFGNASNKILYEHAYKT